MATNPPPDYGTRQPEGVITLVNATVVNIRNLPTTSSTVLGQFRGGEVVPFYEFHQNGWWRIEVSGGDAFVSAQFVSIAAVVIVPPPAIPEFPDTRDAALNLINILKEGETAGQLMYQFSAEFRGWIEAWIARSDIAA